MPTKRTPSCIGMVFIIPLCKHLPSLICGPNATPNDRFLIYYPQHELAGYGLHWTSCLHLVHVGHADFRMFLYFLVALGNQLERCFWWNICFNSTCDMELGDILCRDSSLSQHYRLTYCLYSYRQGREMHTQVKLEVEWYNLLYNHLWPMPTKTIGYCHENHW